MYVELCGNMHVISLLLPDKLHAARQKGIKLKYENTYTKIDWHGEVFCDSISYICYIM